MRLQVSKSHVIYKETYLKVPDTINAFPRSCIQGVYPLINRLVLKIYKHPAEHSHVQKYDFEKL